MLKGVGIEALWPAVLALAAYAMASFVLSVQLYRRQGVELARL